MGPSHLVCWPVFRSSRRGQELVGWRTFPTRQNLLQTVRKKGKFWESETSHVWVRLAPFFPPTSISPVSPILRLQASVLWHCTLDLDRCVPRHLLQKQGKWTQESPATFRGSDQTLTGKRPLKRELALFCANPI